MYAQHTVTRFGSRLSVAVMTVIYISFWLVYHLVGPLPKLLPALFFNVVLLFAVWSYLAAALTDPGTRSSPEFEEWRRNRASEMSAASPQPAETLTEAPAEGPRRRRGRWGPGEVSFCEKCGQERPERAHHCGACDVCVLRMDHHCPWVGSCIGWRNLKFFILLNWWSFWASLVFLLSSRPGLREFFNIAVLVDPPEQEQEVLPAAAMIATISAFFFCLITGGMFLHTLIMVGRNVTSIEENYPGENPYCHSSCVDNLKQVFGPLDWRLLMPWPPEFEATTSGTSYPVVNKAVEAGAPSSGGGQIAYGSVV